MSSVQNRASGSTQHSILAQGTRLRKSEFRDQKRRSPKFRMLVFSTVLEHTTAPQYVGVGLMNEQDMQKE